MEGSIRAKVEYLADDPDGAPTSEQREEFVAVVRSCAPFLHEVLGHRFAAEGGTEPGDADVAVWALLGQLPLPAEAKYRFLAMPSCSARMAALTGALQASSHKLLPRPLVPATRLPPILSQFLALSASRNHGIRGWG